MNVHCNRNIGSTNGTWVKAAITKANGREHQVFNSKLEGFLLRSAKDYHCKHTAISRVENWNQVQSWFLKFAHGESHPKGWRGDRGLSSLKTTTSS
jgi:hypothetical protein